MNPLKSLISGIYDLYLFLAWAIKGFVILLEEIQIIDLILSKLHLSKRPQVNLMQKLETLMKTKINLNEKCCIVTGANSGIGRETAKVLSQVGYHVIMACRSEKRGMDALKRLESELNEEHGKLEFQQLDMSSFDSIRDFAQRIKKRKDIKLCLLVNNAGVMACPFAETAEGFEIQFGVNYLGHFLLTLSLIDLLRQNQGRIVSVGSAAHAFAHEIRFSYFEKQDPKKYDRFFAYSHSKLAIILFVRQLAKEYKGVTINCVHPGVVATNIAGGLWFPFNKIFDFISSLIARTPVEGAVNTLYCCLSDEVKDISGKYFDNCHPVDPIKAGQDDVVAEQLWKRSLKAVEKWL